MKWGVLNIISPERSASLLIFSMQCADQAVSVEMPIGVVICPGLVSIGAINSPSFSRKVG
jgi:hypothetical protein